MSLQLIRSATLSMLAMAAMAVVVFTSARPAPEPRPATAHGSIARVLISF